MIVAKLGGSTLDQPQLPLWIEALAGCAAPLVIVPGGGPFADQVRMAQNAFGFSDRAAHAMAILAMEQFAHVVLDRDARLVPARSLDDMHRAAANGRTSVWLPSALALAAPDIPQSWDITSDSLAAWLAGRIGAGALLLIKQTDALDERDTPETLAVSGVVDKAFPAMLPPDLDLYVAGPKHAADAAAMLAHAMLPGVQIVTAGKALQKTA